MLLMVTTDGNGIRDMFTDGEDAFVAKIGDIRKPEKFIDSLTNKLKEALNTPIENANQMRILAQTKIKQEFGIDKMTYKWLEVLEGGILIFQGKYVYLRK